MKLPVPRPIYLDYHATTPVDPRVAAAVLETMTDSFGNANSEHVFGEAAAALVAEARDDVAGLLGGESPGVHFTSGSTESIRLAVAHQVDCRRGKQVRILVSAVEHRAVFDAASYYERSGDAVVTTVPVDAQARLDLEALEDACRRGIDLVCVMAGNNEVGTLYPIDEIARVANKYGAAILVDATQTAGRVPTLAATWLLTYVAVSGHKIYGPKGVGALVVEPGVRPRATSSPTAGAGDGTPNVPGIVGLGLACRLRRLEMSEDEPRIAKQRDRLQSLLLASIDGLSVNGDQHNRLTNNLHVSVPGVPSDAIVLRLRRQVAISTGAACSTGSQAPSHVLQAMGLSTEHQEGALRIGLGKFTSDEEVERAADYIARAVADTRAVL